MHAYLDHRLFMVQHLFHDTSRMISTLKPLIELDVVMGIPYSNQPDVVAALQEQGIRVETPASEDLNAAVLQELQRSLARCARDGRKLIIQEVGGYAVPLVHEHFPDQLHLIAGSVEITKQGVWRAQEVKNLAFPLLHCAESALKKTEALLVGDAVVMSLDSLLRRQGYALAGRQALVMGYGWIGRSLCRALRRKDVVVGVYDPDPLRLVEAQIEGYATPDLRQWLPQASLVVGAAGALSIDAEVIDQLSDQAILASASSRDIEIDLPHLHQSALSERDIADGIRELQLADGRALYLINGGFPVNFIGPSVPDEIVEFILAEVLVLIHQLATQPREPGIHPIEKALERVPAQVWLDMRKAVPRLEHDPVTA